MFNRTIFQVYPKDWLALPSTEANLYDYLMAMKLALNSSRLLHLQAFLSHSEQTPCGQRRPFPQQTDPASCLAPFHEQFDL